MLCNFLRSKFLYLRSQAYDLLKECIKKQKRKTGNNKILNTFEKWPPHLSYIFLSSLFSKKSILRKYFERNNLKTRQYGVGNFSSPWLYEDFVKQKRFIESICGIRPLLKSTVRRSTIHLQENSIHLVATDFIYLYFFT